MDTDGNVCQTVFPLFQNVKCGMGTGPVELYHWKRRVQFVKVSP